MIPAIGYMIGTYVLTRMASLIGNERDGIFVKFLAAGTIFVTLFCLFVLLLGDFKAPIR